MDVGVRAICGVRLGGGLVCSDGGSAVPPGGVFVSVSVGYWSACGVRADGAVVCWGEDSGDWVVDAGPFVSVDVGESHGCGVRVGGGVVCWEPRRVGGFGVGDFGQWSPPAGSFVDVAVSSWFSCGLRADGEVVCWGAPRPGGCVFGQQVCPGWAADVVPPGPFAAFDVASGFAGSDGSVCAVRAGGGIVCWGEGEAARRPPAGEFVAVDVGYDAACGVRAGGRAECWGRLDWRAGDVPGGAFEAISGSRTHACGLRRGGAVECWGDESWGAAAPPAGPFTAIDVGRWLSCGLRRGGAAVCWGDSRFDAEAPPPGPFAAIEARNGYACGLRPDGTAECWGSTRRSLSPGDVFAAPDFGEADWRESFPGGAFSTVSSHEDFACGIRAGGELECWSPRWPPGAGVPDATAPAVAAGPVDAAPGVSPNRGFTSLSADVRCAFRGDGTRLCWTKVEEWVVIPRAPAGLVAMDGLFSGSRCGIHTDGTLECWWSHGGELGGDGPEQERFPFPGRRFTALSAGHYACAIDIDGTLACTSYGYPVSWAWDVPGAHLPDGEFESVSAGNPHMCGVRVGGDLACWRSSYEDPSAILSPPAGKFTSVSVGRRHACAVRVGGRVVCWGDDEHEYEHDYGQSSPPGGLFRTVAVNGRVSCGIRVDGDVECWGLRGSDPQRNIDGWNSDRGLWPRGPFTALDVERYWGSQICALRPGGEVVCWNDGSATHRPPGGAFVALDAGYQATCGLRHDGEVDCWGYDPGFGGARILPLEWDVPAGPFTAVSVGNGYACALRPGGEVACWGHGKRRTPRYDGTDTVASLENRRRLEAPPGPFTAISAYDEYTCGLRPDGDVACWGMRSTSWDVDLAAPPPGPFTAVRAGSYQACGLRRNGDALCWNTEDGAQTAIGDGGFAALVDGVADACALRPGGELVCGDPYNYLARTAPDTAFRSVATFGGPGGHDCGLDFHGEITCRAGGGWHVPTPPGPFTAVTVGGFYSCGLRPDGTAECWTPHWPPTADAVRTTTDPPAPQT